MKRSACLLFALIILAGVLCACRADVAPEAESTVSTDASSDTGVISSVPQIDMNNFEFRILCRSTDVLYREVEAVDTAEFVDDAIYTRNRALEDKFNCKINVIAVSESPASTLMTTFRNSVSAGLNEYHLALGHMMYTASESLNGTMYNWNNFTYVDFEKPWWHQSLLEEATTGDNLYFAASDYCISSTYFTWLMIYNMELCQQLGYDVYGMVENGTWTLDEFMNIVNQSYSDIDGQGSVDTGDMYGFVTHYNTAITNWMFALDIPVTEMTSDGSIEVKLNNSRMQTAVEKIYKLLFESSNGTLYFDKSTLTKYGINDHDKAVTDKFSKKEALFVATRIFAMENLRNSDVEYGIVPFPKMDLTQEKYYSHVDGRASLMFIPYNLLSSEEEYVSAIIEELSFMTYQDVMPVIENVALLGRYSRDDTAYKMLTKTLEGRTYSFAYIYNKVNDLGLYWMLSDMMSERNSNFASAWKRIERVAERNLNELSESLQKLG